MRLSLVLLTIVLLAFAANQPCFAKEVHAQHRARSGAIDKDTSAEGAGTKSANPAGAKANGTIDADATPPPPVRPPYGVTQQRNRNVNPSVKIITPQNSVHGQAGATTTPAARNAIGQPIAQTKNFVGAQPHRAPALQGRGAPAPILHAAPPAAPPVVSSSAAHANAPNANLATLANRGSINGAGAMRPAAGRSGVGGPTRPNYGINGTTVQNKH
jgi:hypothetical protein